jgi:CRISPR-associated protein Cmr6
MGISATPAYMRDHLGETANHPFGDINNLPPGHRFNLYFPCWQRHDWQKEKSKDKDALRCVTPVGSMGVAIQGALHERQRQEAKRLGDTCLSIEAQSSAPFMTGMGMEHPLENGFSFLSPYGIPYLPGSGIKGVLRRAAEDLALGKSDENQGWDILAVWRLFGFEASSAHLAGFPKCPHDFLAELAEERKVLYRRCVDKVSPDDAGAFLHDMLSPEESKPYSDDLRQFLVAIQSNKKLRDSLAWKGGLSFWDAFPRVESLVVEILNPHQNSYYQQGNTPADCESPVPIFFLAIPEGAWFTFHVQCITHRLSNPLKTVWRQLLTQAFAHAFDWFGFGAKTAVGYGQFQPIQKAGELTTDSGKALSVMKSPPSADSEHPSDPEAERQARVDGFKKALPKSNDLPAQVDGLLQKIQAMEDEEARRRSCRVLIEHARSDKKKFKEAEKAGKAWVKKLKDLCVELGLD